MTVKSSIGCRLALALVTIGLVASPSFSSDRVSATAETSVSVAKFAAQGGDTYFALMLQGGRSLDVRTPHDHAVVMDTSASQVGVHRTQGLGVLKSFLKSLPAHDRVCIFASDVATSQLTEGFVAPQSDAALQAVRTLENRAPLGATNLSQALNAALEAGVDNRARSIVYIGDGMSTANLVASTDLQDLLVTLREQKVPVHSYAVGPRTDLQLLGVLALQTGGVLLDDQGDNDPSTSADQVGQELAAAVDRGILYPSDIQFDGSAALLPKSALPLRSDRETIYLGHGVVSQDATVRVQAAGKTKSLPITAEQTTEGTSLLAALWNQSQSNDGLRVALAGRRMLNVAQHMFDQELDQLVAVGQQAVATRNVEAAQRIGRRIVAVDPGNVQAQPLLAAGKGLKIVATKNVSLLQDEDAPPAADPTIDEDLKPLEGPQARDLLAEERKRREIRAQQMQLEVAQTIEVARSTMQDDPEAALALLKRTFTSVKSTTDIDPEIRQQLMRRLEGTMADARAREEINEMQRIRAGERLAVISAQGQLNRQMELAEQNLEQLIDKVRGLIDEGVHGRDEAYEEAVSVAEAAVNLEPGNGAATAARFTAESASQLNMAFRWRAIRAARFLETLEQVEISHVPFPDEPPVRWPNAEVWRALTERRKKWASVDLHSPSKAEERITAALDDQTDIEFPDTPLVDAMAYLSELHGITIILDETALLDEGIAPDEPINRVLTGISLRSALKIMLQPLLLTYIIEDEVMKITTEARANDPEKLQSRVYPVGDLVIPIQQLGGGGLGGQGGGLGGGQGGGLGGGQGGGGQFGGGGGGFFNVGLPVVVQKPEAARPKKAQKRAAARKAAPRAQQVDPEVREILNGILGADSIPAAQEQDHAAAAGLFNNAALKSRKKKPLAN